MRVILFGAGLASLLWAGQADSSVCAVAPSRVLPDSSPVPEWQQASFSGDALCLDATAFVARQRAQQAAELARRSSANAAPTAGTASGYVPKTKDDNTPWRFDMNQNGKRMTADEFDAWMKAKGIRVATGKPAADAAGTPAAAGSQCPGGEGATC